MKTILLLATAVIAGAVRYPSEGAIPVRNDTEADLLIEMGLGEAVSETEAEPDDALDDAKVPELKKLAADEAIDLGTATSKADIIAAIRSARAARAAGE